MNRGSLAAQISAESGPGRASMRPRFMNRGSLILADEGEHPGEASMRPRFMNRGSVVNHLIAD